MASLSVLEGITWRASHSGRALGCASGSGSGTWTRHEATHIHLQSVECTEVDLLFRHDVEIECFHPLCQHQVLVAGDVGSSVGLQHTLGLVAGHQEDVPHLRDLAKGPHAEHALARAGGGNGVGIEEQRSTGLDVEERLKEDFEGIVDVLVGQQCDLLQRLLHFLESAVDLGLQIQLQLEHGGSTEALIDGGCTQGVSGRQQSLTQHHQIAEVVCLLVGLIEDHAAGPATETAVVKDDLNQRIVHTGNQVLVVVVVEKIEPMQSAKVFGTQFAHDVTRSQQQHSTDQLYAQFLKHTETILL